MVGKGQGRDLVLTGGSGGSRESSAGRTYEVECGEVKGTKERDESLRFVRVDQATSSL